LKCTKELKAKSLKLKAKAIESLKFKAKASFAWKAIVEVTPPFRAGVKNYNRTNKDRNQ
jgi:hypothetical protein